MLGVTLDLWVAIGHHGYGLPTQKYELVFVDCGLGKDLVFYSPGHFFALLFVDCRSKKLGVDNQSISEPLFAK